MVPLGLVVAHRDPDAVSGLTVVQPDRLRPAPTDRYVPELPEEVTAALTRIALIGPVVRRRSRSGRWPGRFRSWRTGWWTWPWAPVSWRPTGWATASPPRTRPGASPSGSVPTGAWRCTGRWRRRWPRRAVHRESWPSTSWRPATPAAAVPYALEAARQASAVHAHAEVLTATATVLEWATGPDRVELLALRGFSLVAAGDPAAPRCLREALSLAGPDWAPFIRLALAQASILSGDVEGAAEALEGLEPDGGPNDGAILLLRGMVAYFRGDIDAAELAARDARESRPGARGARGPPGRHRPPGDDRPQPGGVVRPHPPGAAGHPGRPDCGHQGVRRPALRGRVPAVRPLALRGGRGAGAGPAGHGGPQRGPTGRGLRPVPFG